MQLQFFFFFFLIFFLLMQLQFQIFPNYLFMQLQFFFLPELILHKFSVEGYGDHWQLLRCGCCFAKPKTGGAVGACGVCLLSMFADEVAACCWLPDFWKVILRLRAGSGVGCQPAVHGWLLRSIGFMGVTSDCIQAQMWLWVSILCPCGVVGFTDGTSDFAHAVMSAVGQLPVSTGEAG